MTDLAARSRLVRARERFARHHVGSSSRTTLPRKRSESRQIARSDEGHTAPRQDTTPCRRVLARDRARGRPRDREVRCARTGRAREDTFARSARGKGSASTGGCDTAARSAGARASASTGGSEAGARSAGARASASTGGGEPSARSAGARRSASTGGGEPSARSCLLYTSPSPRD